MLQKRSLVDKSEKAIIDQRICAELKAIITQNNYTTIHAYLPMGDEVDILPLLEELLAEGKTIITPKTLPKHQLENLVLNSIHELEDGVFGTQHPANSNTYEGHYDMFIIPGLAFDSSKNRLGYGGGYYDTLLEQNPEGHKVAVCYPFQVIEEVPVEEHDVVMNLIISG